MFQSPEPLKRPTSGVGQKKNNSSDFSAGMQIKHPQYGIGTIITLDGALAQIAFPGLGIKKMNVEIAPIE